MARGRHTTREEPPGLHLLLVEDSDVIRLELRRRLIEHPRVASVVSVPSVAEARDWIARRGFDLWLLDFQLGDGTALDLLADKRACHLPGDTAIVTAFTSPEIRRACFDAGARYFLSKLEAITKLDAVLSEVAGGAEPRTPSGD